MCLDSDLSNGRLGRGSVGKWYARVGYLLVEDLWGERIARERGAKPEGRWAPGNYECGQRVNPRTMAQ